MTLTRGIMNAREPSRIDIGFDYDVAYWAAVLGVSRLRLYKTMAEVGDSVEVIRKTLARV